MQQPEQVVAFLLDKGNASFVNEASTFDAPWGEIVAVLMKTEPLERARVFEQLCKDGGESIANVQALVYTVLEQRFAKKREASPLTETPPALLDVKARLDEDIIANGLRNEEDGDAMVFAELYNGQVAYDHSQPQNGWHLWNGQFWEQDTINAVINLIRTEVAAQYVYVAVDLIKADKPDSAKLYYKRAARLHTRPRKEHVLWSAASLPGIALSGDEWDSNPWLLATTNGVIDLQSGNFRPGKPTDWIKTVAPTAWEGLETPAPRWERFLGEIFDGDIEIISFLQRLLGYGITGLSDEHAFPVLWGPQGRNGKTTLLETLAHVLGKDMTMSIPSNEIMHSYNSQTNAARPFIAKLRGKRLVWAAETTQDRRLDAETVKALTGGDKITARAVYANPIEFIPTHLLFLLTNYRPKIEAADNAVWDRVHLIPFLLRFVETPRKDNERPRDAQLQRKLRAEAPGILAWLVRGCLEWQRAGGLFPPDIVRAATEDYREEEDSVTQFIDDYCVQSPDTRIGHRELYREYVKWCKDLRLWASGSRDFGVTMKARFETRRMTQGICYFGVGLPLNGPSQQMALEEIV